MCPELEADASDVFSALLQALPGLHMCALVLFLPIVCCCRLSGHVHAGCTGDRSAVISALELRGASLVIAHSTSLGAARVRQ